MSQLLETVLIVTSICGSAILGLIWLELTDISHLLRKKVEE